MYAKECCLLIERLRLPIRLCLSPATCLLIRTAVSVSCLLITIAVSVLSLLSLLLSPSHLCLLQRVHRPQYHNIMPSPSCCCFAIPTQQPAETPQAHVLHACMHACIRHACKVLAASSRCCSMSSKIATVSLGPLLSLFRCFCLLLSPFVSPFVSFCLFPVHAHCMHAHCMHAHCMHACCMHASCLNYLSCSCLAANIFLRLLLNAACCTAEAFVG